MFPSFGEVIVSGLGEIVSCLWICQWGALWAVTAAFFHLSDTREMQKHMLENRYMGQMCHQKIKLCLSVYMLFILFSSCVGKKVMNLSLQNQSHTIKINS